MKKNILAISLLLVLLFTSACSSAPTSSPPATGLGLAPTPWSNGETTDYEWLDDASGSQIGTSTITITQQTPNWIITEVDSIGQENQTIQMTINIETLKPVGEQKNITADVNGTQKTASVDVPQNAVDNDQLLMTLRSLPFSEGYNATYVIVNTMNATLTNGTFTVQPQETVSVPAGSYNTWKVEMNFGQTTQYAWYEVDSPHTLVKYDNGTIQLVMSK
jgi:hypothetical protein